MKATYRQENLSTQDCETQLECPKLEDDIKRTRIALDAAYAGFDYVIEEELIDSYIYQINALQKRYNHLIMLAGGKDGRTDGSDKHSPVGSRI